MKGKAFEFRQVSKRFTSLGWAVRDLDFSVQAGEFLGILGLNGAGKSTTLRLLSTLCRPTGGQIDVFGRSVGPASLSWVRAQLGWMPQDLDLPPLWSVQSVLALQGGLYGLSPDRVRERVEWILDALALEAKRTARIRDLSGGMKRRILLARSVLHAPPLLLLDEPTAGVDLELKLRIWALLKQLNRSGTTIVLASHHLEEVECLCRSVAILERGTMKFHGPLSGVLSAFSPEKDWKITVRGSGKTQEIEGMNWLGPQELRYRAAPSQGLKEGIDRVEALGWKVVEARLLRSRLEGCLKPREDEGLVAC